jgi:hypothetical protein
MVVSTAAAGAEMILDAGNSWCAGGGAIVWMPW